MFHYPLSNTQSLTIPYALYASIRTYTQGYTQFIRNAVYTRCVYPTHPLRIGAYRCV